MSHSQRGVVMLQVQCLVALEQSADQLIGDEHVPFSYNPAPNQARTLKQSLWRAAPLQDVSVRGVVRQPAISRNAVRKDVDCTAPSVIRTLGRTTRYSTTLSFSLYFRVIALLPDSLLGGTSSVFLLCPPPFVPVCRASRIHLALHVPTLGRLVRVMRLRSRVNLPWHALLVIGEPDAGLRPAVPDTASIADGLLQSIRISTVEVWDWRSAVEMPQAQTRRSLWTFTPFYFG